MKKFLWRPIAEMNSRWPLKGKKQLQSSTCFGQIMNELIALDVMNYHDENCSQTHSLAAPAYSTKDTRKYLNFTLGIHIQKYGRLWWQIFLPFWTNNEWTYCPWRNELSRWKSLANTFLGCSCLLYKRHQEILDV